MVYQELSMVHARKDFYVPLRIYGEEMFYLRFSDKGFFRTIPEMNVFAVNGF